MAEKNPKEKAVKPKSVKPKTEGRIKVETSKTGKVIKERKGLPRTNKPVVLPDSITFLKQPTLVTLMKYDFSVTQLRIFLSLIERLQETIEESLSKRAEPEQLTLFREFKDSDSIYLAIPTKNFGFSPDRYAELKTTLRKMVVIPVEIDTKDPLSGEDSWLIRGLFEAIVPKNRYSRQITIKIDREIAKSLVNVDKGFTKFIKEIAVSSKNKYTVRIYMLISSWKDRGGYRIPLVKFRNWLQIGDKYKEFKDLYKRVIRPCYEELFEKADCWFEMKEEYNRAEDKEPAWLNFKIIKATVTVQEQEKLTLHKRSIEGILFRRFQLPQKQTEEILNLVTLDNLPYVNDKIGYLGNYISDHRSEIQNVPEYVYKALMRVFEWEDYEDVKEK